MQNASNLNPPTPENGSRPATVHLTPGTATAQRAGPRGPAAGTAPGPTATRTLATQPPAAVDDNFTAQYVPFGAAETIKLSPSIIKKYICKPTKSGAMPDDRDVITFLMLCRARKLNPFDGDAFLVGYDGKDGPQFSLITAHQALLKRAEEHPQYDGMDSGVIVADLEGQIQQREGDFFLEGETILGGWARVHRRDRNRTTFRSLRLSTRHKGNSFWNGDPAGMIVKCAEADALRSTFPNSLAGMYVAGEPQAEALELPAIPKAPTQAETVKARLSQQAPAARPAEPAPDLEQREEPRADRAATMRGWMIQNLRDQIAAARGPADLAKARKATEIARGMIGAEATETLLMETREPRTKEPATEGNVDPDQAGDQAENEPPTETSPPAKRPRRPAIPREPGVEDE